MKNLSELALKNKVLVWYFIILVAIAGVFSYMKLGRMEDPAYTVRQMVITVAWPGATATQMQEQVTDKLERQLQDTKGLSYLKSYSKSGQAVIYVTLDDKVPSKDIRNTWHDVRNTTENMKRQLPEGVVGPFYNDRFDDVYGSVYALTGDGYTYEDLRKKGEQIRRYLVTIPDVSEVKLLGVQDEQIAVELANDKLAALGIPPQLVAQAIHSQNQMTPAGRITTADQTVYLRLSGNFDSVDAIRNVPLYVQGSTFRLGDIATVKRGYPDPLQPQMYYNGKPAIGIALSMKNGGNILTLGTQLKQFSQSIRKELPVGMELHQVSDQPQVVKESIADFIGTLREAIIIVLVVSFLSLGIRTGMVVACCIPLVLAGVFCVMKVGGIDLHKVSLGSLIISLGLLVDDAIIAVEMMSVQLERGKNRMEAACFAFRATAKPMLTGTLVTCAGFIPVAFAEGAASEFCRSLFPVIFSSLIISWIVSVMVAPLFGYYFIKVKPQEEKKPSYQTRFYVFFRQVLQWCLHRSKVVIVATLGLFLFSIGLLRFIPQEFFPPSLRPEVIVEMTLPEGSSLEATKNAAQQFAADIQKEKTVQNYSYYVGEGAPRFVLTWEPVLPADNYAQFIIVPKDIKDREVLTERCRQILQEHFPDVRGHVKHISIGPPSEYPVMLRVSGYDPQKVKEYAEQMAARIRMNPNVSDVFLNWEQKSKILHIELDHEKLRALGISAQDVGQTLYTELSGATIAQYYDQDKTIGIQMRLQEQDRKSLQSIDTIPIYTKVGYIPLGQVAKISYGAEEPLIWRRNLKPTVTIQGDIREGTANDATQKAYDAIAGIRNSMPFGYDVEVAGDLENSQQSLHYLLGPIPLMIIIIITLLMFQLRNVGDMILTLVTAPLGIIGVSFGMLISGKPMGFVAYLGILALSGMIIRNSVILIDQIKQHIARGEDPWHAVIDSAILRFRPIMLTAAAAILGMIPLMRSIFWGPMAVAIASGLFVATILTLVVLPVMYVVWHKITPPDDTI